nr:unnamed protein product [Callosobruchus chinensis]
MHRRVSENKTAKFVPINKVIISFEAQELPTYISINQVIFEVSTYIQKVILCHNCMRYGPLGKQCKGEPRCAKCKEEHASNAGPYPENEPKCFYCEGNHYTYEIGNALNSKGRKILKSTSTWQPVTVPIKMQKRLSLKYPTLKSLKMVSRIALPQTVSPLQLTPATSNSPTSHQQADRLRSLNSTPPNPTIKIRA